MHFCFKLKRFILLPCVAFSHHKFDAAHPGICFLGDPWKENVTVKGGKISWKDIGVEIEIPPGAVPKGKSLELRVRPCLSGPYSLPQGYQLASPVYLITPAFEFVKEVRLSVTHFAHLDDENDCNRMTFISSSSSPVLTPQLHYNFKLMKGGIFKEEENNGVLYLKHFCQAAIAQQESNVTVAKNGEYVHAFLSNVCACVCGFHLLLCSPIMLLPPGYCIQFYQSELLEAVFSVSLCQPVFTEVCV